MNAITDYKKRFFNLLESKMGDVKPLITEDYTGPQINDANNALKYFAGVHAKNKTVPKGTTWLGKNTFWQVTSDWKDSEAGGGSGCDLIMRGIVMREGGLYFDVSNQNESFPFMLQQLGTQPLYLTSTDGNSTTNWNPKLQRIKTMDSKGTPGGNMAYVGGLANFKSMVNGLPDKNTVLKNFISTRQSNPNFGFGIIPKDQQDLYPPLTATPTKTPVQQPVKKP